MLDWDKFLAGSRTGIKTAIGLARAELSATAGKTRQAKFHGGANRSWLPVVQASCQVGIKLPEPCPGLSLVSWRPPKTVLWVLGRSRFEEIGAGLVKVKVARIDDPIMVLPGKADAVGVLHRVLPAEVDPHEIPDGERRRLGLCQQVRQPKAKGKY